MIHSITLWRPLSKQGLFLVTKHKSTYVSEKLLVSTSQRHIVNSTFTTTLIFDVCHLVFMCSYEAQSVTVSIHIFHKWKHFAKFSLWAVLRVSPCSSAFLLSVTCTPGWLFNVDSSPVTFNFTIFLCVLLFFSVAVINNCLISIWWQWAPFLPNSSYPFPFSLQHTDEGYWNSDCLGIPDPKGGIEKMPLSSLSG